MNRLKARRKELLLTQKRVAEKLGIKWQSYQQYEYGEKLPNVLLAIKIANTLKTTVDVLWCD